jgi:TolA-binding protein
MRFTRYTTLATLIGAILIAPASAPAAASKEMMDLQRDVAGLGDQVTAIQKTLDSKLTAIDGLLQQALDTANKTSSSVNNINSGVTQTLQSELKGVREQLNSVNGLSVKVDNIANDVSDLHSAVAGLVTAINREQQQLNDIGNQVKLLSAPPAAPPGTEAAAPGSTAAPAPPAPSAQTLFSNAKRDQDAGNLDLAINGFTEFLRLYPDDPNAIRAQYNIGDIYYSQTKLDEAVKALDAAIEKYDPDPHTTPSAYYMKGLALRKQGKKQAAITTFQDVIRKYRNSPEAEQARTQLTSLGAAPAPAKKK